MKKASYFFLLLLPALWSLAGCGQEGPEDPGAGETVVSVSLPDGTKTALCAPEAGVRKVYWTDGDCIALNGTASDALSGIGEAQSSATFRVPGSFSLPYDILYPASIWKDAGTVTLPSAQTFAAGTPTPLAVPLCGQQTTAEGGVALSYLCTVLRLQVLGAGRLASVSFAGNAGEQVCGDFTVDYALGTLALASSADADKQFGMAVDQPLSAEAPVEVYLVIPAGSYSAGFTVTLKDDTDATMTLVRGSAFTCVAGHVLAPAAFTFAPSASAVELSLPEMDMDVIVMDGYNVTGKVEDTAGNPVEGVVVTDGRICVRTLFDGSFYMQSDLDASDFIYISTPAGYLPPVKSGIPQFYKRISDLGVSGGVLECGTFTLTPVANPDNCTLFFTADPQPRARSWSMDRIAYNSLDCCSDLYRELRETAATVSGRQVYGICLGDIVHEDMSLFSDYAEGLATLGYPTFNVMGNHDNDPEAADDAEGAVPYESWFGPRNYSFNIGKMHFVVLDDIAMYRSGGTLKSYNNGLDDTAWNWLRSDLATVNKNTTLMVCAHGAMFRKEPDGEVSSREATLHGDEYAKLIRSFREVHAWAGHSHSTFNYIYPASHRNKNIQVHTLARSTGELWTNEYLSAGTPRGFTIVEVRNGVIQSWRFHATKYQTGAFRGSSQPDFTYRDWDYVSGVAKMRSNGNTLSESYQMHVYPPGAYEAGYLYVNVFLWDTKWDNPVFISGSSEQEMEHVPFEGCYDCADKEMVDFYKANASILKNYSGYPATPSNYPQTMFRVPASASGSGTVMVLDRFGNEYRQKVNW